MPYTTIKKGSYLMTKEGEYVRVKKTLRHKLRLDTGNQADKPKMTVHILSQEERMDQMAFVFQYRRSHYSLVVHEGKLQLKMALAGAPTTFTTEHWFEKEPTTDTYYCLRSMASSDPRLYLSRKLSLTSDRLQSVDVHVTDGEAIE